ncbi:MFS transporter [Streptosporangium pseudovulgare]|uniref:MFS transporter n=1 Tax=Streptosporangium pseudovulgare TaxID=35765 RepID=A0ABQ2QE73_9ACTN|nr:MFS transporter [Streptosporangium pseudovulgare]GGP77709.1 MFS transporter [Streptosporangium pseudovulgare]
MSSPNARGAGIASFVGTSIEWYDFYIYGTASALVFGRLFFPEASPAAGVMASFATFWVGFLARPLGGVVFGHLGDRIGRKRTLVATLLLMGGATTLVGVLPTYATAGVLAPVLLAALRLVQGIAVGGEWGGAVLIAAEHAGPKRIFYAAFAQQGSPAGSILATGMFALVSLMPDESFMSYGWRLPFLASAVLLVVGLVIRLRVEESPEFVRMREQREVAKLPVAEVFRSAWPLVLLGIGASGVGIASAYFTNTFILSWATTDLGIAKSTMLNVLLIVAVVQFVTQPIGAVLGQRMGAARFMLAVLGVLIVCTPVTFVMVGTGSPVLVTLGLALSIVFSGSSYAALAGFLAEAFPARVRYTGISLAYQLCGALIGGTTPMIAQALLESTGSIWPVVAQYLVIIVLTMACVAALRRRSAVAAEPVPASA